MTILFENLGGGAEGRGGEAGGGAGRGFGSAKSQNLGVKTHRI
jgi:hypothetical protein